LVSDTGQLAWYVSSQDGGLVTIDTERTQAQIGFVKANAKPLRHLMPGIDNQFASIILTALDDKAIDRSTRLLLIAGAAVANTGMEWNESRTSTSKWGAAPTLIEPVTGRVLIRNLKGAKSVMMTALDGSGRRIGQGVLAQASSQGWSVQLGNQTTTWYEVKVSR
ncbi:MAG TPA: hypothetical protein VFV34_09565, partial [Blastocatellia bacterium]|nr:hypothetical protein [Blastocatellia bacterium]